MLSWLLSCVARRDRVIPRHMNPFRLISPPLCGLGLLLGSAAHLPAASVTFEAESGALGSEWAVSNSASPAYVTILSITTTNSGSNPASSNRVATYSITFPSAGTYQLYARVRVGPNTFNDDSLFYAASFGPKNPTLNSDWIQVNGLGSIGFSNSTDVVTGGGSLGSGMWKWVNLSQFTSQPGFTVGSANLNQTFQIGAREDGLDMDKFLFGTSTNTFTVAELDAGGPGTPPAGLPAATSPISITNSGGVSLVVGSNGIYTVTFASPPWRFTGYLAQNLTNRTINSGADNIGAFSEISFNYTNAVHHAASVRLYVNSPIVLLSDTTLATGANDLAFPRWLNWPSVQNHLSFGNTFSPYNFTTLFDDNLWLFFQTNRDAFIISAATNYMISSTVLKADGSISCGINSGISQLPSGFTHRVILTAQNGINQSYSTWGGALLSLAGKTPPANDAAVELNKVGYWTDNGAAYYYANPPAGLPETLIAVKNEYRSKGVPLGYMQLDSWWYQKGLCHCWQGDPGVNWPSNGIYQYLPDPLQFTNGLAGFQQQLGLPLFTHARWIDFASPYRTNYAMSGNVCIDPAYWSNIMSYIRSCGVVSYEQDWLGVAGIPNMNLTDPPAYLNLMASSAAANGLNLQYCMVQGRDYLQGSIYTNLMTTRTCPDVFDTNNWTTFIYGSRIAQAMGIWPWSDVFRSAATRNLLLSTLSAGPVGPGDALGTVNATNLLKSVRPDGVIVKPDVPLVPVDEAYVNDALGFRQPFVATTYTDHTNSRAAYLFAFGETATNLSASFTPAGFGISTNAYVYDYFARTGTVVNAGSTFNFTTTMPNGTNGGTYLIVVPIGPSGIGFIGDTNKFVTRGKKRISVFSDTGLVRATVAFAPGETNLTLSGYAPSNPYSLALNGSAGNMTYNPASHWFNLSVAPDNSSTATVALSLAPIPVLQIAPTSSGQVQITWPEAAVGYSLERATNLSTPWTFVTNAVNSGGGQNIVTITNRDSTVIYRLKQ
jgi:hypothetical protein